MKNAIIALWKKWDWFWFSPRNLLGIAYMRVVLLSVMTYIYTLRLWNLDYFTDSSWIPRSKALLIFPEPIRPLFGWFFWPDSMNLPVHVLFVALLILLLFGIGGRYIMWLAWIIDIGFMQRNFSINFGADLVCSLFLFYMSFTQSCERLSVINLFRKKTVFKQSDTLSSMAIRMIQVQISVIYVYTGFEKLKGMSWWDGTALWSVLANPQMVMFDMSFMRNAPTVIAAVTFLTVIFEIYFVPFALWKKTRPLWLLGGAGFHLGIAIVVGLLPFSAAMMSTYFLFMTPLEMKQEVVSLWDNCKKLFST